MVRPGDIARWTFRGAPREAYVLAVYDQTVIAQMRDDSGTYGTPRRVIIPAHAQVERRCNWSVAPYGAVPNGVTIVNLDGINYQRSDRDDNSGTAERR